MPPPPAAALPRWLSWAVVGLQLLLWACIGFRGLLWAR